MAIDKTICCFSHARSQNQASKPRTRIYRGLASKRMRRKCGDDQTLRWHCLRSTSTLPFFLAPYDLTPPLCNLPALLTLRFPSYTPSAFSISFMVLEGGIEAEVLTYLLLMALFRHKSGVIALLHAYALLQLSCTANLVCLRRDIPSVVLPCRTFCSCHSLLYRIHSKNLS
jgi:hypothetical protein